MKVMIPRMRANRACAVINITSISGQITFRLGTRYHGNKFAVEGLSELLNYELGPHGIHIRILELRMIKTNFGGSSFDFDMDENLLDYAPMFDAVGRVFGKLASNPSAP